MDTASSAPVPAVAPAGAGSSARGVLTALCITEITSWGVLYYAFPVLAPVIAADTGWSTPAITAAFSAALTRCYAPRHLPALTTLTLVAGLASTVFAPLTNALAAHLTWRGVYLTLAAVLAAVTIPLHAIALCRPWPGPSGDRSAVADHAARPPAVRRVTRSRPFWLLAIALTLSAFAMFAVLINLIPLLTHRGASPTLAAWALGLGGIGQVAGRLCYRPLAKRTSVRGRTVWVLCLSAATTAALALIPGPMLLLIAVVVLAGVTRGIATLLQATAVTDRWGIAAYGTLSGVLAAPVTVATALAPWAGAALADALGSHPALFTVLAIVAALAALLASVPDPPQQDASQQR